MRHLYELPNLVYSLSNVAGVNLQQYQLYTPLQLIFRPKTLIEIINRDLKSNRENEYFSAMWRYEPPVCHAHSVDESLED